MIGNIIGISGAFFGLAITLLMFASPFLMLYSIYRAVKGLMTHNANLKRQRDNDEWRKG